MTAQDDKKNQTGRSLPVNIAASSHGKEGESISVKSDSMEEISKEIDIPKEVREIGVEKVHGIIELPPDIKKLGVSRSGSQTPVSVPSVTITLPITDDQIISGSKAPVTSAIKWLSVWCLKKLKTVHLVLKNIHGKIVRVDAN